MRVHVCVEGIEADGSLIARCPTPNRAATESSTTRLVGRDPLITGRSCAMSAARGNLLCGAAKLRLLSSTESHSINKTCSTQVLPAPCAQI